MGMKYLTKASLFILLLLWACTSDPDVKKSKPTEVDPPDEPSIENKDTTDLTYVGNSPVWITEIDSRNSFYKDADGEDPGWVELYNPADTAVNLKGLSFLNAKAQAKKWTFGDVWVPAKSYIVVFFSEKNLIDALPESDSTDMMGTGCWGWADSDPNTKPAPGASTISPVGTNYCYTKDSKRYFGAKMQLKETLALPWQSAAAFLGVKSSDADDNIDISKANELLFTGYLSAGVEVEVRLAQSDLEDFEAWSSVVKGTGDSNTTYKVLIPQNTKFPDLTQIYGVRISPLPSERRLVEFDFHSILTRFGGSPAHTSFKLSKSGGNLYLVNADLEILDSASYPALPPQKSWAKNTKGVWGFADPSPGADVLGAVYTEQLGVIDLPASGFFTESFEVQLFGKDGEDLRCEMGGAVPTESSKAYNEAVTISLSTVLRCALFREGALAGPVMTRTYLMHRRPDLPVVMISGNPLSLFDPDSGIYMPGPNASSEMPYYGANFWLDKELPIHIEFFEATSIKPDFSLDAGFKIFGNYSRSHDKKSVSIHFREDYGETRLNYTLFPEYPELTRFKSFILRNGGNSYGLDYIRDMLASSITKGLGVDYQKGRAAVVFYNGDYYGIHNIRERSNKYYFETNYDIDPLNIDLLKAGNEVSAGSALGYIEMMDWIDKNGVVSQENYDYIASLIDIDNYLNYMHIEIFNDNRDWPGNNLKKWRTRTPVSRWKWILYDQDFGWGYPYSSDKSNIFAFVTATSGPSWPNGPEHTLLLRKLLENESFKLAFINRFSTLVATYFTEERLMARIDELMNDIQSEVYYDKEKWYDNWQKRQVNAQLDTIKSFAKNRQALVLNQLQSHFKLGEFKTLELSVSGPGQMSVHGLPLLKNASVSFFEGLPVLLAAVPKAGGVFMRWSDGETQNPRLIMPESFDALKAEFK